MNSLLGKGMATKIQVYAFAPVNHMDMNLEIFLFFVVIHGDD
jgi:hypothetical protein